MEQHACGTLLAGRSKLCSQLGLAAPRIGDYSNKAAFQGLIKSD
jgi:hypothetical protein